MMIASVYWSNTRHPTEDVARLVIKYDLKESNDVNKKIWERKERDREGW